MRRISVGAVVLLAIGLLAQIRLSRGEPIRSEPLPPALWENTHPPGRPSPEPAVTRSNQGLKVTYAAPSSNCPALVSTDPTSQYALTAVENGVLFDIDADGDLDRVAWTEAATDVAFLTLDRDGDGRITSGRELVGDHTLADATNGPSALLKLATAHSGMRGEIDSDNPLFAKLLLWRDANHNGTSERDELQPADRELATIGLGYEPHRRLDSHGNQSRFRGFVHVRTSPGTNSPTTPQEDRARRRYMYDVCLVVQ